MKSESLVDLMSCSKWEIIKLSSSNPEFVPESDCSRALLGLRIQIRYQTGIYLLILSTTLGISLEIRQLNYQSIFAVVKERVDALIQERGPQFEILSDMCCKSYVCGKFGMLNGENGLPPPRFNIVHAPVVDGDQYHYCFMKMGREEEWVMSGKVPSTDTATFSVLEELVEPLYLA
jgi:hypothetical protein